MTTMPQTKREAARDLLTEIFRGRSRVTIAEAMEAATERGISRRTMIRACGDLKITEVHNGPFGGIWASPAAA